RSRHWMAKRLSPGTDPVDDTERRPRCRVLLEASLVDCLLPALHRARPPLAQPEDQPHRQAGDDAAADRDERPDRGIFLSREQRLFRAERPQAEQDEGEQAADDGKGRHYVVAQAALMPFHPLVFFGDDGYESD